MCEATRQEPLSVADSKLIDDIVVASDVPTCDLTLLHRQLRARLAEPNGRESLQELLRFFWQDTRREGRAAQERAEHHEISFTDCEAYGIDIPGVEGHRGEDGDGE